MPAEKQNRQLAAIFSANAEGYSHLTGEDEAAILQTLNAHRQTMCSTIERHQGRVVGSEGDRLLAVFDSAAEAVQCAIDIQEQLRVRNEALPAGGGIPFRIGVHLGEVTEEEGNFLGDGVQTAARLEGLAGAGGICISGSAYLQVKGRFTVESFTRNLPYKNPSDRDRTVQGLRKAGLQ